MAKTKTNAEIMKTWKPANLPKAPASPTPPPLPWASWVPGGTQGDIYKLQQAAANDLSRKYGFDYTPEFAERQAELERQAKERAAIQHKQNVDRATRQADTYLSDAAQYMPGGDDFRLGMLRGTALGVPLQDAAQPLDRKELLQRLAEEAGVRRQQLYADRQFQQLDQINKLAQRANEMEKSEAQLAEEKRQFDKMMEWQKYEFANLSAAQKAQNKLGYMKLEEEKRQFKSEMEWRKYVFNNLSAAQKAEFEQLKQQLGDEQAWRILENNRMAQLQREEWAARLGAVGFQVGPEGGM